MTSNHTYLKDTETLLALGRVASTADGRKVLAALLADFGVRRLAKGETANDTYFALGMQSAAFAIEEAIMNIAPDAYKQILTENAE